MKRFFITLNVFFLLSQGYSQTVEKIAEAELKSIRKVSLNAKQLNNYSSDNYDVTQYYLSFDLRDTSNTFSGVSKIYLTVLNDSNTIQLDAQSNLTIDDVKLFGQNVSYTHQGDKLILDFDNALSADQNLEIEVNYHSLYSNSEGMDSGMQNNIPIIATLSESFHASSWWVGADNLTDKANIVDIKVQHSPQYKVGSNGKLIDVTPQADGSVITHWRTSYPIPAYLISLAMSNYVEYNSSVNIGGTEMPIINYIYPRSNNSSNRALLDRLPSYIQFISDLVGEYPYKEEKYGIVQWNWGGGMEHSTMSSQNSFGDLLSAHELAHHWFGDKITCATWSDIWLNEGFATYFEGLLRRSTLGEDFFTSWKRSKINNITSARGGSVYVPESQVLDETRIFSSRLTYNKGAMVLNMLRFKLGDDNFYQAIRNYLADENLAYKFAKTEDLKQHFETQSGEDLTEFFNDWVYGEGYPTFEFELNLRQNKKSGTLKVTQTTSHSSVSFFETPFEIEFVGVNGERQTQRFDLTTNNQSFEIQNTPFEIVSYVFNPNQDIIAKNNVRTLGTQDLPDNPRAFKLYPNPTNGVFYILDTDPIKGVKIFDLTGKLLKSEKYNSNEVEFSIAELPKGVYVVQIEKESGIQSEKIIRQ